MGAPSDGVDGVALPPSERVFVVSGDGGEILLGASGRDLWAARFGSTKMPEIVWRVTGPAAVELLVGGDIGRGRRIYAARGASGRDRAEALVLEEIDPATGAAVELWHHAGERNEAAHLSISDVNRDGRPDLAFAWYASTYEVRTRHLVVTKSGGVGSGGEPPPVTALEGSPIRMATSRVYADVDGDGSVDEVVGRLYGDTKEAPGDLRVDLAKGMVAIPTEGGVRSLVVVPRPNERPALVFADGWVANYGGAAKARVKAAIWDGASFVVSKVAESPDEFTFFDLVIAGDSPRIVARGNKRLTVLEPTAGGAWRAEPWIATGQVLDVAVGRSPHGGWLAYLPGGDATRGTPLPAPAAR